MTLCYGCDLLDSRLTQGRLKSILNETEIKKIPLTISTTRRCCYRKRVINFLVILIDACKTLIQLRSRAHSIARDSLIIKAVTL